MNDLIGLLSVYYACDAAAIQSQLSLSDAMRCSITYQAVKVSFLTPTEREELSGAEPSRRAALMQVAYLRFKAWEEENPEQVDALRPLGDEG